MSILQFIDEYLNGNDWEKLCIACYQLRYKDSHYTPISAMHEGDGGIEGFTQCGVVHQSYCPERKYSDNKNYEHLRDKMTEDIKKLFDAECIKKLKAWGVPPIKEWHFVIPEQNDSRIVKHAETKRKEVLSEKKANKDFVHIDKTFKVLIKSASDFRVEISTIIRTNLTDMKLNLAIKHTGTPDWDKCESEKAENIRRKIKTVMQVEDNDAVNEVVTLFIESYIKGLDLIHRLRLAFPDFHEEIIELERVCKWDVSLNILMSNNPDENRALFMGIMTDFEDKLSKQFSGALTPSSIGELKQDLVASWLADCSMEFKK